MSRGAGADGRAFRQVYGDVSGSKAGGERARLFA
jgi:hypothetical protein